LTVGHAAYDLFLPLAAYPIEDRKYQIDSAQFSSGGPAANAASLVAHWGAKSAFVGLVGRDIFGTAVIEELNAAGVDISCAVASDGFATHFSVVLRYSPNGSSTIINRKTPGVTLPRGRVDLSRYQPAVLLFDGHELEASLEALASFPAAKSVLDAGSLRPATRELASKVDFVVASERFAADLAGVANSNNPTDPLRLVDAVAGIAKAAAAVTLGERGLVYGGGEGSDRRRVTVIPALPVKAVDTTAAGDIFHGAFAYGVLQGWALSPTVRFAAMAAALSVTRPGGRASIPALAEVRAAISSTAASAA
jgi:sugar/nucleoside kinase (ribokinase family)